MTKWRYALSAAHELPPGSLGPECMRGVQTDDRFYLRLAARYGPFFKLFWGSRDLKICLVGFDRGRRLLARHHEVLNAVNTDITPVVPHGYLRSMRGSTHSHYRRTFTRALNEDLVTGIGDQIRDLVRHELASLEKSGAAEVSGSDLTETLNRISSGSLLLLMFGLPRAHPVFRELYTAFCELGPDGYIVDVGRREAEIYAGIREKIAALENSLRSGDADDLTDSVLRRLITAVEESELDETLIGNSIYMVERGRHDLRDLLRWIVKYLIDNPRAVDRVRGDTQQPGQQPFSRACVMETLRLDQAESVNRQATRSFDFDGYHIPRNSWVAVLLRESHRNADVFEEPDAFRPERFLGRAYSRNEFSPFGLDAHNCIGSGFVYSIGSIFIEELVGGYEWEVVADGPRQYGHFHWQPARHLAIRLSRI
jgi:cytochrome P450